MRSIIIVLLISLSLFTNNGFCAPTDSLITSQDVVHAEKLVGLEFTDTERDSLLDDVYDNLNSYRRMREIHLDNAIPPAILFNPVPVGMSLPMGESRIAWSDYAGTKLPDDRDKLAFYSVGQLAELIRSRQITSEALTKFFLQRLKSYGPKLECVVTLTEELALKQARHADQEIAAGNYRGPLHGIPCGIKDLLATKGYKTTWGTMPYKDQMIDDDATVVKKLHDAGAVLVAKLTMGALAWGDVWFGGMTRNPWDVTKGSSGSSAGPASAVSAGLVPFAIGTETWGSIVSPSTVCGVTGLRPTYGRVSRTGAMALSWSMDKIGPICRTVEDCAMVFNAIYGPDGIDQTLYDVPFHYYPDIDLRTLKIGYLKSDFDSSYDFKTNDSLALNQMQVLGVTLIPIELPDLPISDISFILSTEAAAAFDELTRSNKDDQLVRQIKNAWPNVFRAHRFVPAVEYINANRIRFLLIQQMARLMESVDLCIAPSWQGDNLLLTNLTGHPCVVVPNGFSDDGMPTSFCFIGRLFDEGTILAVAKKYQDASGFHLRHPVIAVK
ncbi:amidase [candidate division KSB1 bacterium]|nr:amidase [candidate division KSB1 bacterium]